jgi:hypothetical protein
MEQWIQEEYTCDVSGDVRVKIRDTVSELANEYRLGRWSKVRKKPTEHHASGSGTCAGELLFRP